MSSIKCPHCGLVNFSSVGACKRCRKDLAASADSAAKGLPTAAANERSYRIQSDNPLLSWAITIVFLIINALLTYVISRKTTTNSYRILGGMIGGILGWPLILLIVFAISKRFREKYSLHAVINYGLALNVMILGTMTRR